MVVMFIIMLAGVLLYFLLKPPIQTEIETVYENVNSVDLDMPDMAFIKRIDV
ncbi:hypothetical protein M5X11_13270 [Paenibacillus alginolyticus]|uniref:Uncharacterized protein n=1 Tax=Paenibacillus alginolyticus TaxID=59839 RepID=A0ABT4GNX9_9BACL|nr:hypothetical protein [Paenibacillus alginolyticus]MCY9665924.1 hypothetical protein [Paenibacillus alginolyticus]MCY9697916.1 hypothetical protein [Paenibacillus alginolyticus]MEC0145685.1 hypothetical protein [Paenibacillus alginolyticus]